MKTDYPRYKKGDIMNTHDIITDKFYYGKSSQYKNTIGNQHCHNLFEIYYLEEGSCHYFIDNETYEAKAGDIVLIPEGIIHKTVYLDSDAKRRLIYCTQMHIPAPVSRYLTNIGYIYRNKKVSNETLSILNEIEKEWSSPDKFSDNMILCHMHRFFFLLARNPDTEVPSRSTNTYTTATIAYIKENYFEDVTLTDLAARCMVTPEHLSRTFKRDTGLGISEYLSITRLQHAQFLLRSDLTLSIAEVAKRCGFNDSNYFSKRFKEAYGISPLSFRKV